MNECIARLCDCSYFYLSKFRGHQIGNTIKEKIVPHAVLWFTGEAQDYESFFGDEEGGEEDDEDGEGGDDDDDDEEAVSEGDFVCVCVCVCVYLFFFYLNLNFFFSLCIGPRLQAQPH